MEIDPKAIEYYVRETITKILDKQSVENFSTLPLSELTEFESDSVCDLGDGVFTSIDAAVRAAELAYREYILASMADRRRYIQVIRDVASAPENLEYLAKESVAETGMGNPEHKYRKNKWAALHTPGVEDLISSCLSGDYGLTVIEYCPFGVIGAICPATNPTETIINNAISMIAAGNTVVFCPNPRAKKVSSWLVKKINQALIRVDAPRNLITTINEPSIEATNMLTAHPLVSMLVASGGPAVMEAVLRSGKKAIAAGAGNPPCVVDGTADVEKAAKDIVNGASFDNNIPCIAEKEVIAVDSITDLLRFCMQKYGAYEIEDSQLIEKLTDLVVDKKNNLPNPKWVGKSASEILAAIGVDPPSAVRLIIVQTPFDHPFCQIELMMPVLAIVRAENVDKAIEMAVRAEHGNHHTAIMHSTDVNRMDKMARLMQTAIFVKNGPSYSGLGIGGEGFATFTIAGLTGEGLTSARSFARIRRNALISAPINKSTRIVSS